MLSYSVLTTYKKLWKFDIFYGQAYNMSFHQKLESVQYNACLTITGAIRGTSKGKRYQELGFELL